MAYIMVDVEADGQCPGLYSMISLGAIVVEPSLSRTFYATFKPISDQWMPEALAISNISRVESLQFPDAALGMACFDAWLSHLNERIYFVSDNNGFDW